MYNIIHATNNHIEVIQALAHEIWPKAYGAILSEAQLEYMLKLFYSHASLQDQIETRHHTFILIKDENHFVGFASFCPHVENKAIFHLNKIYVLPSEQGKHAGKQMLDYVIEQIKKENGTSLQLNVNRHNKAFHFYEKQGFTILREEDIDIGEGYWMNDWVMERKL